MNMRSNWMALISVLPLSTLMACSAMNLKAKSSDQSARIRMLERELRKRQVANDDLRERNLVLEQRLAVKRGAAPSMLENQRPVGVGQQQQQLTQQASQQVSQRAMPEPVAPPLSHYAPQQLTQQASQQVPQTTPSQVAQHVPEELPQTGEQRLYSKVLESYRIHNGAELQKAVKILLKTYPDSVYADNALYLAGLLALEANDLARSGAFMDRVLREYPKGNKVVSALFAKAMIEKRGRNYGKAKSLLQTIRKLYPGSPEALRVGMEEKIIDMAAAPAKAREG